MRRDTGTAPVPPSPALLKAPVRRLHRAAPPVRYRRSRRVPPVPPSPPSPGHDAAFAARPPAPPSGSRVPVASRPAPAVAAGAESDGVAARTACPSCRRSRPVVRASTAVAAVARAAERRVGAATVPPAPRSRSHCRPGGRAARAASPPLPIRTPPLPPRPPAPPTLGGSTLPCREPERPPAPPLRSGLRARVAAFHR